MSVLIYSKRQCPACIKAKALLDIKGISYKESIIGEDILREDFVELFPNQQSVPFIVVDGKKIGGFDQLREWVDNRPQFLQD